MGVTPAVTLYGEAECAVLDATRECVERFGFQKVTMDDICVAAKVSRATVYRMFPGGRDVLFEAVRERSLADFFTVVRAHVEGADSLEEVLVRCVTVAHAELMGDQHLATMLATEPGETLGDLTVNGVSRIVRVAAEFMSPLLHSFVEEARAQEIVEIMCRLVISAFLAPSPLLDFSNEAMVRRLVRTYLVAPLSTH
ncbi:MAG: TetR/AcrR family transcriptional regulator [Ilumatobacteraceae bacterium]|jgi:AcrR family transcriptional regulator|nr:TetR/AcrR family transcriptional regulator [Ilumatobacteraceae bacterium]